MDSTASSSRRLLLLALVSFLFIQSATSESVFFIDSPDQQFLRSPSHAHGDYVSVSDVSAAVSVLLGFPPSHMISASSAEKINDILSPSPFDRPRAVLLLKVTGVPEHLFQESFPASLNRKTNIDGNSASIQLPGRDDASVIHLDEPLSNTDLTDKHIADLAQSIGGSYDTDAVKSLSGELTFLLDNGKEIKLQMSKVADKDFAISLLTFMHNINKAIKSHLEATNDGQSIAELLMGSVDCLKGSKEEGVAKQRAEFFVSASLKYYNLLMEAHKGQIAGVIFVSEEPSTELTSVFEVTYLSRSLRELVEKDGVTSPIIIARVLLVRTTIAWITGILLLIATLLGVYFLMNMPLTRDTLLYSNVKLD